MGTLVMEKQLGLRQALRNMGMKESAYWSSWMAWDALLTFLAALLLVIFGLILQFDYFKKNDFGVMLILFWLFGLAMTSFSYFLSVFMKQSQSAVYLGFVIFIVGWVFQTVQFAAQLPYSTNYYFSTTNKWGKVRGREETSWSSTPLARALQMVCFYTYVPSKSMCHKDALHVAHTTIICQSTTSMAPGTTPCTMADMRDSMLGSICSRYENQCTTCGVSCGVSCRCSTGCSTCSLGTRSPRA
jgi:hypothetical protein